MAVHMVASSWEAASRSASTASCATNPIREISKFQVIDVAQLRMQLCGQLDSCLCRSGAHQVYQVFVIETNFAGSFELLPGESTALWSRMEQNGRVPGAAAGCAPG
jgi:hypothetical protein